MEEFGGCSMEKDERCCTDRDGGCLVDLKYGTIFYNV